MEIISRVEALARGLKRYFTSIPCRYGHVSQRHTCDTGCIECRRSDPVKQRARRRKWFLLNPTKKRVYNANRNARVREGGEITTEDIEELFILQEGKCAIPWCCEPMLLEVRSSYHVDHKDPIDNGGHNIRDNIQLICPPCNLRKHTKPLAEFIAAGPTPGHPAYARGRPVPSTDS